MEYEYFSYNILPTVTAPITRIKNTDAKFAATQKVFGRKTAGAGDAEEVSASELLDWLGSTRGAILYRGAAGWAILTPGTSGYVLTSGGAGADPSYAAASGGSGVDIIATQVFGG